MDLCLHYQTLACDICPIYAFIDLRVESVENGIYRARVPLSANVQDQGSMERHIDFHWATR